MFTKIKKLIIENSIVPIIIVFSLAMVLLQKVSWDLETIKINTNYNIDKVIEDKWNIVDEYFKNAMNENFILSENIALNIIDDLNYLSNEQIDYYLERVGLEVNNPIQVQVGNNIKGIYFRGIVSNANDPFAILIGKGESDSFLFADFSENCAIEELTRSLEIEYELQGRDGDVELARSAFQQILGLKKGTPINETLFFRFAAKTKGVVLEEFTYDGIKKSFFDNNGDFRATFQSLEFLSPYYIYRDKSLGGSPRIIDRVKTDAKIIGIVSVFSFEEVINNDPVMLITLERYDDLQKFLKEEQIKNERLVLVTGILVTLIVFVLFILFWTYLRLKEDTACRD